MVGATTLDEYRKHIYKAELAGKEAPAKNLALGLWFKFQRDAKLAMRDSLNRGEAPFISHLLYTQVLEDNEPLEREIGLEAAAAWLAAAQLVAVYHDYGMSSGVQQAVRLAGSLGIPVVYRTLSSP